MILFLVPLFNGTVALDFRRVGQHDRVLGNVVIVVLHGYLFVVPHIIQFGVPSMEDGSSGRVLGDDVCPHRAGGQRRKRLNQTRVTQTHNVTAPQQDHQDRGALTWERLFRHAGTV